MIPAVAKRDDQASSLSYQSAGVDIERADALVSRIAQHAGSTHTPGVLGGVGGFASLFSLRAAGLETLEDPILVSGTDGVGTKLKVATVLGRHDGIGQDLVAMCVNDIATTGARPLFFLDYLATGKIEAATAERVVAGIAAACRAVGAALVGGETAEMPGMYASGDYDLAGFAVGIVGRKALVDGRQIRAGDVVVGYESHGVHSNGLSLARRVVDRCPVPDEAWSAPVADYSGAPSTVADELLRPTCLYAGLASALAGDDLALGMAHITGGGLPGNLGRCLPSGQMIRVRLGAWPTPAIFSWLSEHGPVDEAEMYRTFNMGVGFAVVTRPEQSDAAIALGAAHGLRAWCIGEVVSRGPSDDDAVRLEA